MIFLLLVQNSVSSYGAIDLGTQYIKASSMDINGNIKIVPNSKNKMMTPAAVAFKPKEYSSKHLTNIEALQTQIKIGDDAVRLLKNRPELGSAFVPRLIGRSNISKEFPIPPMANASEMLALILKEIFSNQEYGQITGSVIAVPAFYTRDQRRDINDAMWAAKVNFYGVIDDDQAIATLYSIRFAKRFLEEPQSVLFVDIGSTSIKAYRCEFDMNHTTNPPTPLANVTSYEWTEKCGGEIFARKIAKSQSISIKKAQKLMISNMPENVKELLAEELKILEKLIKRAVNGRIDQIQIFGGCSRYQFLLETIQRAASNSEEKGKIINVNKELPAYDAIAFGAMHVLQDMQNLSVYQFPNLSRCSPYNSYVECNGTTEDFCYQSANCTDAALFENTMCTMINFLTDPENIPEGCTNVLGQYELVNISKFPKNEGEGAGGFLMFKSPSPVITGTLWCRNYDIYCDSITTRATGSTELQRERQLSFVETLLKGQKQIEKTNLLKARLAELTDRVRSRLESNDNNEKGNNAKNDENRDEVRGEAVQLLDYMNELNAKTHNNLKLETMIKELEIVARYLGIPVND